MTDKSSSPDRVSSPCASARWFLIPALLLTACAGTASGAVLQVPSQFGTILDATIVAQVGDVIEVAPGTYTEDVSIWAGFTLRATSGPAATFINGRVTITGSNGTLEGFTVSNPSGEAIRIALATGANVCGNVVEASVVGVHDLLSTGSRIENNRVSGNGNMVNGASGGVVLFSTSAAVVSGNLITGNNGPIASGISLWFDCVDTVVTNCTVVGNIGDGFMNDGENTVITNSIFWGNSTQAWGGPPQLLLQHCIVEGGTAGAGILDTDPLLTASGQLTVASPAIDAGVETAPGILIVVLDGEARIQCQSVDIGADEFSICERLVRGDVNSDGVVVPIADAVFLLSYSFQQGAVPPCFEAADVDGDGTVHGLADSVRLLTHFFVGGPPPASPFPSCGTAPSTTLGCSVGACP
ncbi:MAG: hypothetical protein AAF581_07855 [Planctomycetota bacterium]